MRQGRSSGKDKNQEKTLQVVYPASVKSEQGREKRKGAGGRDGQQRMSEGPSVFPIAASATVHILSLSQTHTHTQTRAVLDSLAFVGH
jgi:hypothetical protein